MKAWKLVGALACLLVCSMTGSAQQEKGNWRAVSTTAKGVTGDVGLSEYKIYINFTAFTIAQIRTLKPEEASAAFASGAPGGSGNLYRMSVPASKQFLHHNTLCGSEDTQWMATYAAGKNLQIAFFSGETMPVFTTDALKDSTSLCGTFSYVR